MYEMTNKQRAILDYIKYQITEEKTVPSLREIATHFEITPNGARNHMILLRKKGYIEWQEGKFRSITLKSDTLQRYREWYAKAQPLAREAALLLLKAAPSNQKLIAALSELVNTPLEETGEDAENSN
jgi:SOS-response transcriptional repressor LexA